jgi:hypothetical protein
MPTSNSNRILSTRYVLVTQRLGHIGTLAAKPTRVAIELLQLHDLKNKEATGGRLMSFDVIVICSGLVQTCCGCEAEGHPSEAGACHSAKRQRQEQTHYEELVTCFELGQNNCTHDPFGRIFYGLVLGKVDKWQCLRTNCVDLGRAVNLQRLYYWIPS